MHKRFAENRKREKSEQRKDLCVEIKKRDLVEA